MRTRTLRDVRPPKPKIHRVKPHVRPFKPNVQRRRAPTPSRAKRKRQPARSLVAFILS